jgi:hypothetical protein
MLGYFPGKPIDENSREFVMVTLWQDMDALEKFVGADWKTPVVTPDEEPLVEEMYAHHYIAFGKEGVGPVTKEF